MAAEDERKGGDSTTPSSAFGGAPAISFSARRSPVYGRHGMVSSSQPYATEIGMRILKAGGNAADAAVAVAATLNLTEPCSTGIGGDCFALYYNAETKTVEALNGSGRAPAALTLEKARADCLKDGATSMPRFHAHSVTVPGAAAGWADTVAKWGTMPLSDVLAPVIDLAEEGFVVSPITAYFWNRGLPQLRLGPNTDELTIDGRAPVAGEIFKNPNLAATFRSLAEKGVEGFYTGRIAKAIVELVQSKGGVLTEEDLAAHKSTNPDPIHVNYHGVDVYEVPPNGQGITALVALQLLNQLELPADFNDPARLHILIECMRIAFADTRWYVADPDVVSVPIAELISEAYAKARVKLFNADKATLDTEKGSPVASSNTVSFQVVDGAGNSCAFINSNYMGFGTGLIPKDCGFTLQNRGHNFSLDPAHPNCLAPNKRPYHTIIPGMALKDGNLWASFSVMGGFMQPQGHVQVITNMVDYGMNPQEALDAARFCIRDGTAGGIVCIEDGTPDEVVEKLREMGHELELVKGNERSVFGRGQIIRRDAKTGVLCGGSDGRADGCAMGW